MMSTMENETSDKIVGFLQTLGRRWNRISASFYDFLSVYFRLEVEGLENVPASGRGLIVANHSNALGYDALMLAYCLDRNLNRKPLIMTHPFWFSNRFLEAVTRNLDLFPADLKEGLRALSKEQLMLIFP